MSDRMLIVGLKQRVGRELNLMEREYLTISWRICCIEQEREQEANCEITVLTLAMK